MNLEKLIIVLLALLSGSVAVNIAALARGCW